MMKSMSLIAACASLALCVAPYPVLAREMPAHPTGVENAVRAIDTDPAQSARLSAAIAKGDVAGVRALLAANGASMPASTKVVLKKGPIATPMKGKGGHCKTTHTVKRTMLPSGETTYEITDSITCG